MRAVLLRQGSARSAQRRKLSSGAMAERSAVHATEKRRPVRADPARSAQRRKVAGGTRAERSAKRATKKRRPVRTDPARSAQRRKLASGTRAERSATNATSRRRQNENCYTTCYGKNKRSRSEIDCILSLG